MPTATDIAAWALGRGPAAALVLARAAGLAATAPAWGTPALDGPLRLVGALVESYRVVPAGGLAPSPELAGQAFGRVGQALELAVRAAAPAAVALAAAGIALGLLGRAAAARHLLSLALPIR